MYCEALSEALDAFLQKHHIDKSRVLGAGLSLPVILSPDGCYICLCHYQTEAAAAGAALMHIERYLNAL